MRRRRNSTYLEASRKALRKHISSKDTSKDSKVSIAARALKQIHLDRLRRERHEKAKQLQSAEGAPRDGAGNGPQGGGAETPKEGRGDDPEGRHAR